VAKHMLLPANRASLALCDFALTTYAFQAARKVTSEHGHRAIGGRRCAAEGWKPVDDDGSHPTLLLLKRRNTSDEPMTAGRAAHSLRIRFDFMLAARPCYSLHWTASIRWPETPACERPHAGVVWTRQIGPINWGGRADRRAALFLRRFLDL
jgi:hypothetical protein